MTLQTFIESTQEKYPQVDKDTLKLIVIDVVELIREEKSLQLEQDKI